MLFSLWFPSPLYALGGIIQKNWSRDPRHVFGLRKCCPKTKKKFRNSDVFLCGNHFPFYITGGRRFWTFDFGEPSNAPQMSPRAEILQRVRFFHFDSNEPKKLKFGQLWTHLGP